MFICTKFGPFQIGNVKFVTLSKAHWVVTISSQYCLNIHESLSRIHFTWIEQYLAIQNTFCLFDIISTICWKCNKRRSSSKKQNRRSTQRMSSSSDNWQSSCFNLPSFAGYYLAMKIINFTLTSIIFKRLFGIWSFCKFLVR